MSDKTHVSLLSALANDDDSSWDAEDLKEYKRFKQDMSVIDGVALYKARLVIPQVLRPEVLGALQP